MPPLPLPRSSTHARRACSRARSRADAQVRSCVCRRAGARAAARQTLALRGRALLLCLLQYLGRALEAAGAARGDKPDLLAGRRVAAHGRRVPNVLVVAATVRVLHRVHGHAAHLARRAAGQGRAARTCGASGAGARAAPTATRRELLNTNSEQKVLAMLRCAQGRAPPQAHIRQRISGQAQAGAGPVSWRAQCRHAHCAPDAGAPHLGPAVALSLVLVVRVAGLQHGLLRAPAARHLAHHRAARARHRLPPAPRARSAAGASRDPAGDTAPRLCDPPAPRRALCRTLEQSAKGAAARRPASAQLAARVTGRQPTFLEPEGIFTRVRPVSGLCDTTIA